MLWPLVPREAIGTLLQWVTAPSPGAREWLPPSPDATWGNQLLREGKEAVGSGGILRPVLDLSPLGSAPAQDVSQTATSGPWLDLESIAEALIVKGREQGNLTFDDLAQGFLEVLMEPTDLARVMAAFTEMGINVIEDESDL